MFSTYRHLVCSGACVRFGLACFAKTAAPCALVVSETASKVDVDSINTPPAVHDISFDLEDSRVGKKKKEKKRPEKKRRNDLASGMLETYAPLGPEMAAHVWGQVKRCRATVLPYGMQRYHELCT
jgi:hypothetical protein